MNNNNPFSITFGIEPSQYIERFSQTDEILQTFNADEPSNYVFIITGVRGSGKTVLLSNVESRFSEDDRWIVVNASPDSDILNKISAKLYSRTELKRLFIKAKLDLSVFGLGLSVEGGNQIFDIEVALEEMLKVLDKSGKRVLISIDEAVSNMYTREFVSAFQILIRHNMPVFLLMTGLYENINSLQNEKTLTFLYRAPKIMLDSLSINSIARSYRNILEIDQSVSEHMAHLTKGFAFAYQVLGYLYWKNIKEKRKYDSVDDLIPEYEDTLENYVYEKIWTELPAKEQKIVGVLSKNNSTRISDIRNELGLSSGEMSVYRDRLNKRGLVDASRFGYLSLKLPQFGEIIRARISE